MIYNTTSVLWFIIAITTLYKAFQNPFFVSSEGIGEEKPNEKERENLIGDPEEFNEIVERIEQDFIKKEKYLEFELTLKNIANEIGYSSKKTSFVINEHYKRNVSDFINYHRIEKAKELLISPTDKTIIEIAYEVGFNSKATFNRAFTKFTQLSPSEFKLKHS